MRRRSLLQPLIEDVPSGSRFIAPKAMIPSRNTPLDNRTIGSGWGISSAMESRRHCRHFDLGIETCSRL